VTIPGQPSITVDEITPDLALLDVREDVEWAAGHIEGARHLPMGQVPGWLNSQGYQAINLTGGMHAWADAGRPFVSETGADPAII
jgi:rhodanese-related sulfurtransferase